MNKTIWALAFAVLACGVGFAVDNATVANGTQSAWTGLTTAGYYTTEGGNVTDMNATSNASTEKWAGIYGNVTGYLVLTEASVATSYMYQWTYNTSSGGEVCASRNANPTWAQLGAALVANLNTIYGFGNDADNATNTFGATTDTYTIASKTVTTPAIDIQSGSNFVSGMLNITTAAIGYTDFAFCTKINSTGTNFKGENVNFELMVPANKTPSTYVDYYFFVELS